MNNIECFLFVKEYTEQVCQEYEAPVDITQQQEIKIKTAVGSWLFETAAKGQIFEIRGQYVGNAASRPCILGIKVVVNHWERSNYLFMPAAIYNGNRFKSLKQKYPPILPEKEATPDCPIIITDVPRFSTDDNMSLVELASGDMATPAAGIFQARQQTGMLLFVPAFCNDCETGWRLEEDLDASRLKLYVSVPKLREHRYIMCDSHSESFDRAVSFSSGDGIFMPVSINSFKAECPQVLFNKFFEQRKTFSKAKTNNQLPHSAAFKLIEQYWNKETWQENVGMYFSSPLKWKPFFRSGWGGGLMQTLPLLASRNQKSRERAVTNINNFIKKDIAKSGLVFSKVNMEGKPSADFEDITISLAFSWDRHLIRRSADVLYYLGKQVDLLLKMNERPDLVELWKEGIVKIADGIIRVWDREGQLGQFVDQHTGAMIVGNSSSAGIASAGLVLASRLTGHKEYCSKALEIADYYYENFTTKCFSCGGPGEILQGSDSESCYGLLESYTAIYEYTNDAKWLNRAEEQARQFSSWVMSYDYAFPTGSEFNRLEMTTTGTVFANVQNKHLSPGICTHSGISLLKLYRATGNKKYLELLRDIAHAVSQYISRDDRPIFAQDHSVLRPGWINERVNTSDWDNNLGGVFGAPCWCTVAMALVWHEIPGIYFQPQSGLCLCIDNLQIKKTTQRDGQWELTIFNPTDFPASCKVFVDQDVNNSLDENYLYDSIVWDIPPKQEKTFTIPDNAKNQ